jgi:hypothetical protein
MVMDLRRLGFEASAWEDEVLVREGSPAYELQMEGPAGPEGLKPFPLIHSSIQIYKESSPSSLSAWDAVQDRDALYDDEEEEEDQEEDELEREELGDE